MRKLLLMSFLLALFSGVFAQTYKEIPIGEENAYSYSETSYFTYTAPENVFLKVVAVGGNSLSGYIDGVGVGSSYEYSGSNTIYTFAVAKGNTLNITAYAWGGGPYSIYAAVEVTDADIDGGKTCDDAVLINKEKTYVPSNYDFVNYSGAESYAKYQPTEGGTVKILFFNCQAPNTLSVANGCDQEFTPVTGVDDAVNGSYFKLDVEAGQTYIFKLEGWSSSPYYISIVPLETGPGTSCDDPIVPNADSKLILPAEAGTYWFQYPLTLKDGFYIVSSEANLGDEGKAVFVDNCESTWPSFESNGGIKLRQRIGNDYGSDPTKSLHFAVVKPTATAEQEEITVTESPLEEGDVQSMPKTIVADTKYQTKAYSGYYYYEFTLPETETKGKYANIAVTDNTITEGINLQLIDKATGSYLADGNTSVKAPVEPDKTYTLTVNTYDDFSAPFMLTFTDILPGDEYVTAIEAKAEGQSIRKGKTYYKYTATKSGYLKVDAGNSNIIPIFPVASGSNQTYDAYPDGTGYKIEETKGVTYVFYFDNITDENLTFTISELDVEPGVIEANPIALNNGVAVDLSTNSNVTTFYSYTAADNALLELETNMPYFYYYDYDSWTASYTQFGIKDGSWWSTVSGGKNGYQISRPVPAGSTTLLKVITAYDPSTNLENPYTVTATETKFANLPKIEVAANEDGTTSEYEFTAPVLTEYHVKWYYVNIPLKGTFKISSGGNTYAAFRMYSVDCVDNYDENRYVVKCSPYSDNGVWSSEFTYDAPSEGEYILCLYDSPGNNGAGAEVTASFTPDQIALSITSVDNSANAKVTEVYDMSGRRVSNIGNHGIYIVKTSDGKVRKVAVK